MKTRHATGPFAKWKLLSPSILVAMFAATSVANAQSRNWSATNTGLSDVTVLVGDPLDPATLYASGNQGLFKTVNSGGSWSWLADPVGSLLIDFANPSILYAATAPFPAAAIEICTKARTAEQPGASSASSRPVA